MKLIEIKDIRVGQIYKMEFGFVIIKSLEETDDGILGFLVNWNNVNNSSSTTEFLGFYINKNKDYKLIGFLNITHKIEDNKLVEIPREEFEVDDIIKYENKLFIITRINQEDRNYIHIMSENLEKETLNLGYSSNYKKVEKIGIYGVTHTFENDKLLIKE